MRRVTIDKAVKYLLADDTYRKDVYLVQNSTTKQRYHTTDKIGNFSICRVDRGQCNPLVLKGNGFKLASNRINLFQSFRFDSFFI